MLLASNLVWLPWAIRDIHEAQSELQRVAVRGVRDQVHLFLQDKEEAIKSQARLFRPILLTQDKEGLRLLTHRFFQREPAFVEIGIHAHAIPAKDFLLLAPGERAFGGKSVSHELFALSLEPLQDFRRQSPRETEGDEVRAAFALEMRQGSA